MKRKYDLIAVFSGAQGDCESLGAYEARDFSHALLEFVNDPTLTREEQLERMLLTDVSQGTYLGGRICVRPRNSRGV